MTDQPWSDERIAMYAGNAPTAWEAKRLYDGMCKMRDQLQARITELERQLAEGQQWVPVEDGQRIDDFEGCYYLTVQGNELCMWDTDLRQGWPMQLYSDYRLCRRVKGQGVPASQDEGQGAREGNE